MRPGQQNKRGRGRGNNNNNNGSSGGNSNNFNRKGGNPLTRTYDSSGPDVKIRGTAQHIAEKYAALARDAQSSGDRVVAENYLQHAEHYNRIIAAAQAQMQERFQRDDRSDYGSGDADEIDGNDGDEIAANVLSQPEQLRAERHERINERSNERHNRRDRPERQPQGETAAAVAPPPVYDAGSAPQPVIDGTPMEVAVEEEAQQAGSAERAPRRARSTGPRPRRTRRTAGTEAEAQQSGADSSDQEPAASFEPTASE